MKRQHANDKIMDISTSVEVVKVDDLPAHSLYLLLTVVKRETFVQAAVDVAVAQPLALRNKVPS